MARTGALTKAAAAELVRARLQEYESRGSPPLLLLEDRTITRPFGWIFFYQSRAYVDGDVVRHALAGNAPIIVDRDTGELRLTGTAHPVSHYVREYEAEKRLRAEEAWPRCPGCGAPYDETTRIELALTQRDEDGRRVCRQIVTCDRCKQQWWRWNDRREEPLQPYAKA